MAVAVAAAGGLLLPSCKNGKGEAAAPAVSPAGSAAAAAGPTAVIDTGERRIVFRIELARTQEEHMRGLMYREKLAPDAGMLFINERASVQTFWMKNTLIPLDMIFIGADKRIVGIVADAEPQTLTPRRVAAPSQYVLEIGGGLSAKLGIRAGQPVELQDVPPER
jgi:uncharacterized membrane protein (UPF0127 family)